MANEEEAERPDAADIVFEEANEEGEPLAAVNSAAALKKLREKLKICQKERQEFLETSQRLKADYINSRKDEEKARGRIAEYAKADLLHELFDLADSFEMAFRNREAWERVEENWRRGVEYIYAKLTEIFRQHGVEEINPAGAPFDPSRHQSVGILESKRAEDDNKVFEVVQKGYQLNGRVIRPAKVKIWQKS